MKKFYFLAVAVIMALMVSCKNETTETTAQNPEEKAVCGQTQTAEMKAMVLGHDLAMYGYQNESAEALIEAASILATVQTAELEAQVTVKDKDKNPIEAVEEETEQNRSFAPADLLAAAKELAGEDATLLAMIQRVEQTIAAAAERSRGSVYGVRTLEKTIGGSNYNEYEIAFEGGQLAEIAIEGDGSTDLDLYICDMDMNLIAEDVDYSDRCYCSWIPAKTGKYIIRIYNRGETKNNYYMYIN